MSEHTFRCGNDVFVGFCWGGGVCWFFGGFFGTCFEVVSDPEATNLNGPRKNTLTPHLL